MSFTCFACYEKIELVRQGLSPLEAQARAMLIDGHPGDTLVPKERKDAAIDLLLTIHPEEDRNAAVMRATRLLAMRIEIPPWRKVGEHEAWPGERVWLPDYGISVGPCEDCRRERPCVNR